MKKKTTTIIKWSLVVAWMVLIFYMSAQEADDSSAMSITVGEWIGRLIHPHFNEWTPDRQYTFAAAIELLIRKSAHASEYALLAIFVMQAVGRRWKVALPVCVAYAVSDEFHQLFVPGRSGQIKDVCIDSAGVVVGILLTLFTCLCIGKWKQRIK